MTEKRYAGIGSRSTPLDLRLTINRVALSLEARGYTLYSGAATGADTFFAERVQRKKEFLPRKGFNGSSSPFFEISPEALELAARYHPRFHSLSQEAQKLMARNGYQVLDLDLRTPVEFIACWTPGGEIVGGTGQALRIAQSWGIPVFNLFFGIEALKAHFHPGSRPTTVVHCKKAPYEVYIGRPGPWGNQFSHREGTPEDLKKKDRAAAISAYEEWLRSRPDLLARLPELRGKTLGCWCKPAPCHGDVLARLANELPVK